VQQRTDVVVLGSFNRFRITATNLEKAARDKPIS